MAPEVSVVVPTHDREVLLRQTLGSILGQRGVDFEVIVVDDGSSDDTAEVITGLGHDQVRVVRHPTARGLSAARNTGVAAARGGWVAFCDDDDLWAPDKLARQLQAAAQTGANWVYTGAVTIDDAGRILGSALPLPPDEVMRLLERYNPVPGGGSNVVAHREALGRAGPFDVRLPTSEDWEMWIRLAKLGPPAWVRSPLVAKRIHTRNMSLATHDILAGLRLVEQLHGMRADRGATYRWLAESCLRAGRRGASLRYLVAAALNGQAANVAGDVRVVLRRRFRRHRLSGRAQPASYRHPEWIAEARVWLDDLAEAPAAGRQPPT
jgi:glycosyltransferase involved in cell wall biosynthesis